MTDTTDASTTEMVVFNPFDPVWRADPYPFYRRLRAEAPAGQIPGIGMWYFARYADCEAILRDPRWSSDTRKSDLYRDFLEGGSAVPQEFERLRPFLMLDPPDHTRLRGLVSAAFTPKVVEALRGRMQDLVDQLLDQVEGEERFDLIAALAYPLPVIIISELLGVPPADQSRFRGWSKDLAASLDPQLVVPPEAVERELNAMREFSDYFRALIAERRRQPATDLVSALVAVEDRGDSLTEDELLATLILLLVAGHETTVNLIGNGVLALLSHPDQLAHLRAEPGLIRNAVEEILRWDPPVQIDGRTALEDIDVGGVTVHSGEQAILVLAAANRDEAHLPESERFDITRADIRHLSFAFGPHYCLGAPLARAEAQVALAAVVRRFPELRLATDGQATEGTAGATALRYRDTLVLRGLESLIVEV